MKPGLPELMIILTIVVLLFGAGRVSRIGSELGSAVNNFRRALTGEGDNTENTNKPDSETA